MKILKQYVCEICNTTYASEKNAKECEEKHYIPDTLAKLNFYYKPITMCHNGMPYKITLKDSCGGLHTYEAI
jgi:hypothetical protein